ncbi:hypothetical protein [Mongoliimonas terrestris]|uniref:hypothetical protein n=1 Tax=Mongoliimonas terrestris TaxID=1709001 RepID=UPI00094987DA|nr:hypothetical protein [Mongoliimonas terrestris]
MVWTAFLSLLTVCYGTVAAVFLASTVAELTAKGRSLPVAVLIALPVAAVWPVTLAAALLAMNDTPKRSAARRIAVHPPGLTRRV